MKKLLFFASVIFALTFVFSAAAVDESTGMFSVVTAYAATDEGTYGDNIFWTIDGDTLTISGEGAMVDYDRAKDIPWYKYRADIVTVNIGEGITSLGYYAFGELSSLKEVNIPDSVTTLGKSLFIACGSLESIELPSGIEEIPQSCFMGCSSLKEIVFPEKLIKIGVSAFHSCAALTELIFPETLEEISAGAFANCVSLVRVHIFSEIVFGGSNPFSNCDSLIEFKVNEENERYKAIDGMLYNKNGTHLYVYPAGRPDKTFIVSENINSIGLGVFEGADHLESVYVYADIISVPYCAFSNMDSLKYVYLPQSIKYIHIGAFSKCPSLQSINIPYGVETIDNQAFYNSSSLTKVILPASVVSVDESAFAYCDALEQVTVMNPDCVIESANNGVSENTVIKGYKGSTAETYALEKGCEFVEITASDSFDNNLLWVLYEDGSLEISGDGEMTDFDNYSYTPWSDYRDKIKKAIIENGITNVGSHSFDMCRSLTYVSLPDSVTAIGESAFLNCSGLNEIVLPEKLISIGDSAFGSSNIVSLEFPATLESVGTLETLKIESYSVAAENPYFSSENGVLYNKDKSRLIAYPTAMKNTSFTIPDSVTVIVDYAFYYNKYLKSVDIGNGVKNIEKSAFFNTKIETIDFGDSLERIEYGVFLYCRNLKEVHLPDSVTYIGTQAFAACDSLVEITLPNSELFIGRAAFSSKELTYVFIPEKVKTIESNPFQDCVKLEEIAVDENNAYFSSVDGVLYDKNQTLLVAYPAGKTENSFYIPQTVQTIGAYSFEGVCVLKEITVPDTITELASYAFSGADSLEKIHLPDTITHISTGAFSYCKALKEIKLPTELKTIDGQAFYYCTGLKFLVIPEKVQQVDYRFLQGCTGLKEVIFLGSDCRIYSKTGTISVNPVIKGYAGSTAQVFAEENNYAFSPITEANYFGDELIWVFDENGCLSVFGNGAMPEFDSVKKMPWYEYKNDILTVIVGEGITSVGNYAFYQCTALESAELADSVRMIGNFAFFDCVTLDAVNIGTCAGLEIIGNNAFGGCSSLSVMDIPAGVREIGENAFLRCTSLRAINVAEENNSYFSDSGVLFGSYGEDIVLICYPPMKADKIYTVADNVTEIAGSAFAYCDLIEEVEFSHSSQLRRIGQAAFYECSALKSFTVPPMVEEIDGNIFVMCFNLEEIYTDLFNEHFFARDGVLMDWDETTILIYPAGSKRTEYIIPETITIIAKEAFCHCPSLEKVTYQWGNELSVIEESAFYSCERLSYIALPDSLEEIGSYAFMDCASLRFVHIPENVSYIGSFAFGGCASLEKLVFFTLDCEEYMIIDSQMSVIFYVYEGSEIEAALSGKGEIKYLVQVPEDAVSYADGVLTVNHLTDIPEADDAFCYPWTRYVGEATVFVLNPELYVQGGLFEGFYEVKTIIVNASEDSAQSTIFEKNAFVGFDSLALVVTFDELTVRDGAFEGGTEAIKFFAEESLVTEGAENVTVFSFSDGTVSFKGDGLSLTDYQFLDLVSAVCYGYGEETVFYIEFSALETVDFAFDASFDSEADEIRVSYEDIRIVPLISYDGENYERISFNDFCVNAAYREWVVLMLSLVDADEEEPQPDNDSIQVIFEEAIGYILHAIITFFNKILNLFK